MKLSSHICSALLLSALTLVACTKKKEADTEAAASASAAAVAPAVPGGDPAIVVELQKLAESCEVAVETSAVRCKERELRKYVRDLTKSAKTRTEALSTLAKALLAEDKKLVSVTANILYDGYRASFGSNAAPGSVSKEDALALIEALPKLDRPQALQVVPAAVHASMLSEQADALFAAVEQSKHAKLPSVAYRYVMTYGRMQVFPKVQELGKSKDVDSVLAAIESPRGMQNWTPEEQALVCPWAEGFLTHDRAAVGARAAGLLANCSGEFIDRLLSVGEGLVRDKKITRVQLSAYRDLCSPRRERQPGGGDDAQCERNRKMLSDVVASKDLDEKARAMALSAVSYQWPDEQTLKLAKRFENAPEEQLKQRAVETVKRIERRLERVDSRLKAAEPGKTQAGVAPAAAAAPKPAPPQAAPTPKPATPAPVPAPAP
jgi:hypothetical protein